MDVFFRVFASGHTSYEEIMFGGLYECSLHKIEVKKNHDYATRFV
jgi:hypothetical protein